MPWQKWERRVFKKIGRATPAETAALKKELEAIFDDNLSTKGKSRSRFGVRLTSGSPQRIREIRQEVARVRGWPQVVPVLRGDEASQGPQQDLEVRRHRLQGHAGDRRSADSLALQGGVEKGGEGEWDKLPKGNGRSLRTRRFAPGSAAIAHDCSHDGAAAAQCVSACDAGAVHGSRRHGEDDAEWPNNIISSRASLTGRALSRAGGEPWIPSPGELALCRRLARGGRHHEDGPRRAWGSETSACFRPFFVRPAWTDRGVGASTRGSSAAHSADDPFRPRRSPVEPVEPARRVVSRSFRMARGRTSCTL